MRRQLLITKSGKMTGNQKFSNIEKPGFATGSKPNDVTFEALSFTTQDIQGAKRNSLYQTSTRAAG